MSADETGGNEPARRPTAAEVEAAVRARGTWLLVGGLTSLALAVAFDLAWVSAHSRDLPHGVAWPLFGVPLAAVLLGASERMSRATRALLLAAQEAILANQGAGLALIDGLAERVAQMEGVLAEVPRYSEGLLQGAELMRTVGSAPEHT